VIGRDGHYPDQQGHHHEQAAAEQHPPLEHVGLHQRTASLIPTDGRRGHVALHSCAGSGSGSRSPPRALWTLARGNPHAHGTTHVPGGEGGYKEVNPFIISPQTMKSCEHFAHMWDIVGRRFHHSAGVSLGLSPPSHPKRSQSSLV